MSKNHTKNSINYLSFWWLLVPCLVGSGLCVYGVFSMVSSIAAVLSSVVVILPLLIYRILKSIPVRNKKEDNNPQLKMMGLPDDLLKVIHSYLTPKESLALTSMEYGLRNNPVFLSYTLRKTQRAPEVMTINSCSDEVMVSTEFGLRYYRYNLYETFPLATDLKTRVKQVLLDRNLLFILDDKGSVYSGFLGRDEHWEWNSDSLAKMLGRSEQDALDDINIQQPILTGVQKIGMSLGLVIVVALKNNQLYIWGPRSAEFAPLAKGQEHRPTQILWSRDRFTRGNTNRYRSTREDMRPILDFTLSGSRFLVLKEHHLDRLCSTEPWRSSPVENGDLVGMYFNSLCRFNYLVKKNSIDAVDSFGWTAGSTILDSNQDINGQKRAPNSIHFNVDIIESSYSSEFYGQDDKMVFRTKNAVYACCLDKLQPQIRSLFEIKDFPELGAIHQMQATCDDVYFLCESGTVYQYHYASKEMKKRVFPEPILSLKLIGYQNYSASLKVIACAEHGVYGIRYPDDQGNMKIIEIRTLNTTVQALKKKLDQQDSSVCNIFWKKPNETFRKALKMLEDEENNSKARQPGL